MKIQDNLSTKYTDSFNQFEPLQEYPRPLLRRNSFFCLNGSWDYKISNNNKEPSSYDGGIIVPFCLESNLSGVKKKLKKGQYLIYRKRFTLPKDGFIKDKVILHIDAVDQVSKIYFNGYLLGETHNGYLPFSADITNCLKDVNSLVVIVKDDLSHKYPYGKQKKHRGGMWYTPVSGIWKTCWIESVTKKYIKDIKITTLDNLRGIHVEIDSNDNDFLVSVIDKEKTIFSKAFKTKSFDIDLGNPCLWSPDHPYIYDLKIETKSEEVTSYFGVRKIEIKGKHVYLNGKRIFLNGLLDQGYFPEGIYTPSSYKAYADDILTMKGLGFNTLRKHIKVEPQYFYYLCDIYGMLVIQDFVNNGHYSFLIDTALPTVFPKVKINDKIRHLNKNRRAVFKESLKGTVNQLFNHPSIIMWTIFNESWGQFDSDNVKNYLLSFDKSRLIDNTSGWFEQNNNDFKSIHCYFKKFVPPKTDKPILLSEFGGYSYKLKENSYNLSKTYGYRKYDNQKQFEDGFVHLYEDEIIPNKDLLAGTIYTQLSDVEDETNGLLTYDRKVLKVDKARIVDLMRKLK
ncbi:MAG: glycoside hydrolase family 2 [Bacilli bacterium]|nr:glycoside hydrolase family 2 [Bacilli bacterium]